MITLSLLILSQFEPLEVEATAYCLRGTTRSGTTVQHGVIAVDPQVITLGSHVFIPTQHGRPGRWHRAEDTGGAIKGRIIDIWMPSYNECIRWGRRDIIVWVFRPTYLPKGQKQ